MKQAKIVIVGAGAVGSTFAFTMMRSGLVGEIVLLDANRDRAEGEAMDLNHGLFFVPHVEVRVGEYSDCSGASIVVITAGAKQRPGETRLDLVQRNTTICKEIMRQVMEYTRDSIILMVTNPVDILTQVAYRISGLPSGKVIGSGTVLDSARLRFMLSRHCNVDSRNVHAYILGEHGDSEVAAWSLTHIGGIPILHYCSICKIDCGSEQRKRIADAVRDSAYHVIESKGATNFAVSLALENIVAAIVRDSNSVLTVSVPLKGEFGVSDVAMSVPVIVNREGVHHVLEPPLAEDELRALQRSASVLQDILRQITI
ncbi:MAG: L-lactate dehydrogenase [Candidatus Abyssobacteria bacterium SURF_17]|jgi:L-lactate dehydrogenase|uniref:L-lactate dehydrogenase n=1 Tax=Candidatus Abyssobacteria bacterium SURF_17 TaxID=2093361 RepID=A0A419EZU4_9BACT|nr:MAG: L-lactate dehydrogenase [Candidatus Abyssubacteria bacterium SURF_17]